MGSLGRREGGSEATFRASCRAGVCVETRKESKSEPIEKNTNVEQRKKAKMNWKHKQRDKQRKTTSKKHNKSNSAKSVSVFCFAYCFAVFAVSYFYFAVELLPRLVYLFVFSFPRCFAFSRFSRIVLYNPFFVFFAVSPSSTDFVLSAVSTVSDPPKSCTLSSRRKQTTDPEIAGP